MSGGQSAFVWSAARTMPPLPVPGGGHRTCSGPNEIKKITHALFVSLVLPLCVTCAYQPRRGPRTDARADDAHGHPHVRVVCVAWRGAHGARCTGCGNQPGHVACGMWHVATNWRGMRQPDSNETWQPNSDTCGSQRGGGGWGGGGCIRHRVRPRTRLACGNRTAARHRHRRGLCTHPARICARPCKRLCWLPADEQKAVLAAGRQTKGCVGCENGVVCSLRHSHTFHLPAPSRSSPK